MSASPSVNPSPGDAAPGLPLRLAIAIERFSEHGGGAERSTAQIAERLAKRGHDVTVLALSAAHPPEATTGYRVERWLGGDSVGALRLLLGHRWVSNRIDRDEFDAVLSVTTSLPGHVVEPRAGTTAGFQNSRIARRRSLLQRTVTRVDLAGSPKQRLLRWLEAKTLSDPRLRKVVAISDLMADELRNYAGVEADRLLRIPNAGDVPRFTQAERAEVRFSLRRGLSLGEETPLLVFAAKDPRRKGVVELLQAFANLLERRPEARLALVGEAGYALDRATVELGVREAVLLLGPSRRCAELFAAADATVLPTWYDPASKVVIESLMVGTPAITTRLNGSAQFVEPAEKPGQPRGRVIDTPADIDALTDAMAAMCDPEEQRRCAARCSGLYDALSMDRHVDKLEAVLREAAV
jgi:UDP-glucose:(heptosyl)LPS alpha-1,3-glucosyltransferase